MDFLQHLTEGRLIILIMLCVFAILLIIVRSGNGRKETDLSKEMLDIREKTKDIEIEDEELINHGHAIVDGPATVEIEADQPKVIKPATAKKKFTKKKKTKVKRKSLEEKILTYFSKRKGEAVAVKTLQKYFREYESTTVYRNLSKLVKKGKLVKSGRGFYKLKG